MSEHKDTSGKPQMHLVPLEHNKGIAFVREFGVKKYKDPENWKKCTPEELLDATMRHMLAVMKNPNAIDRESGLPHLWHAITDLAMAYEVIIWE